LLGDDLIEPGDGPPRQRPQRIPVEIYETVGNDELPPNGRQRILLIEGQTGLAVHCAIMRPPHPDPPPQGGREIRSGSGTRVPGRSRTWQLLGQPLPFATPRRGPPA